MRHDDSLHAHPSRLRNQHLALLVAEVPSSEDDVRVRDQLEYLDDRFPEPSVLVEYGYRRWMLSRTRPASLRPGQAGVDRLTVPSHMRCRVHSWHPHHACTVGDRSFDGVWVDAADVLI